MAEKDDIIVWRNKLKAGKNLPLRIFFDNNFIADEQTPLNYIKWDDDNGIIYVFRIPSPTDTVMPSNENIGFQVFSAHYTLIQYLELANIPMEHIDDVFNSIGITNETFKKNIKNMYKEALDPKRFVLPRADINAIAGYPVDSEKDDYYYGKRMSESFKETRDHARLNQYIADEKNKKKDDSDGS